MTRVKSSIPYYFILLIKILLGIGLLKLPAVMGATVTSSEPLILAWGDNSYQQIDGSSTSNYYVPKALFDLPSGIDFPALAPGPYKTLALSRNGIIYCWGATWYGGCGVREYGLNIKEPNQVDGFPDHLQVQDVVAGYEAVFFIMSDGSLYYTGGSWGSGGFGGGKEPSKIEFPEEVKVKKVVGDSVLKIALGLDDQGRVWGWSSETSPMLLTSDISATFQAIEIMKDNYHFDAVFLSDEGEVWTYQGDDNLSQGIVSHNASLSSIALPETQICLGNKYISMFDHRGIQGAGDSSKGQLGQTTVSYASDFVQPDLPRWFDPVSSECGGTMMFAFDSQGRLYAWGDGKYIGVDSDSEFWQPQELLQNQAKFHRVKTIRQTTFASVDLTVEFDVKRTTSVILFPGDECELSLESNGTVDIFSSTQVSIESSSSSLEKTYVVDLMNGNPSIQLPNDAELFSSDFDIKISIPKMSGIVTTPLNNAMFDLQVETFPGEWVKSEHPIPIRFDTNLGESSFEFSLESTSGRTSIVLNVTSTTNIAWPQDMEWSPNEEYFFIVENRDLNVRRNSNTFHIDSEKELEDLTLSLEDGEIVEVEWKTQGTIDHVSIQVFMEGIEIPLFNISSIENDGEYSLLLSESACHNLEGEMIDVYVLSSLYEISTENSITLHNISSDSSDSSDSSFCFGESSSSDEVSSEHFSSSESLSESESSSLSNPSSHDSASDDYSKSYSSESSFGDSSSGSSFSEDSSSETFSKSSSSGSSSQNDSSYHSSSESSSESEISSISNSSSDASQQSSSSEASSSDNPSLSYSSDNSSSKESSDISSQEQSLSESSSQSSASYGSSSHDHSESDFSGDSFSSSSSAESSISESSISDSSESVSSSEKFDSSSSSSIEFSSSSSSRESSSSSFVDESSSESSSRNTSASDSSSSKSEKDSDSGGSSLEDSSENEQEDTLSEASSSSFMTSILLSTLIFVVCLALE